MRYKGACKDALVSARPCSTKRSTRAEMRQIQITIEQVFTRIKRCGFSNTMHVACPIKTTPLRTTSSKRQSEGGIKMRRRTYFNMVNARYSVERRSDKWI